MPERICFLDTKLELTTRDELMAAIESGQEVRVATVGPEFMLEARHNERFRDALGRMTHCTIDGGGLLGLLRFGQRKLRITRPLEIYHGADLAEDLFRRYHDGSKRFFLVGGPPELAHDAAASLAARYPGIQIVGATDGGPINLDDPVDNNLMRQILAAKPDILLVGFGAPKQELWIDAARTLPIQVMIGVGGTFGFYTIKKRAPVWLRQLHLEWLFRSVTEAGHARRAFRAVIVFPIVAAQWLFQQ